MTHIDVRETRPDEYRAAAQAMSSALMFPPPTDEQWAERAASWDETISYSAWRDDRCVGQASYFTFDTVVPGGARLATAGVTRVGVQSTARRNGLATRLLRALVDRAAADGLALASLRASEAVIYSRFGFGVAGVYTSVRIEPHKVRPVRGAAVGGTFRTLTADEVLATVGDLYERVGLRRPGMVTRPPTLLKRYFDNVVKASESEYVVVHTNAAGVDDGYVHYSTKWVELPTGGSHGGGTVHEVIAADDATELALWRFLFDVDLVTEWKSDERPIDDLIQLAVRDRRGYTVTAVDDEQWVRLVDADQALAARTYGPVDGSVTIEIADPWVPGNNGRWRISAAGAVRDDSAPADLIAPIETVSAAYLGGHPWWQLLAVGSLAAPTPGAVDLADALFTSARAPFCGSFF